MRSSFRRTELAGALVAIAVLVPTAAWYVSGSREASRRAEELMERARRESVLELTALAERLGSRLEALRIREATRPFYHYQNLYHDPTGAAGGLAVVPSPLARGPADPLIWAHFQIDEHGAVSLPTVSERFPELSTDEGFSHFCDVLGELQNGFIVARQDGREATRTGGWEDPGETDRVIVMDRDTWEQIHLADAAYAELTGRTLPASGAGSGSPSSGPGEVVIRVGPLRWHTMVLGTGPSLAALRQVTTPSGLLVQGFVVGAAGVGEWLGGEWTFRPAIASSERAAVVPVADTDWHLQADLGPAVEAARAAGREVVTRFRSAFAVSSGAALLAALAVVAIVAQTDRLARQRARFAAAAAHELKTPITSLRLHGEMLSEGLGDPDRWPVYAARLVPETHRLSRVVSNMLDLSKLERGAPLARPVPGDLPAAVTRCADRLRNALEDAGMAVSVSAEPDRIEAVFDDDALCQILDNLLDNAEKYSRSSARRRVTVVTSREGARAQVRVSDDGPGIPRAARAALFRPFSRPADPDAPSGLGLGLALARSLARAQGGDLRLVDDDRPGATFELTLRLAENASGRA
jgi:signal transduction histidine kinase